MKKTIILFILLLTFNLNFSQETTPVIKINITSVFKLKRENGKLQYISGKKNDNDFNHEVIIYKENGFLILKNIIKDQNYFSYGPINNIFHEQISTDELSTFFFWKFSNSYNDYRGIAYIDIRMLKNKTNYKGKLFVSILMEIDDNQIIQYEGYIESSDFIRISEK